MPRRPPTRCVQGVCAVCAAAGGAKRLPDSASLPPLAALCSLYLSFAHLPVAAAAATGQGACARQSKLMAPSGRRSTVLARPVAQSERPASTPACTKSRHGCSPAHDDLVVRHLLVQLIHGLVVVQIHSDLRGANPKRRSVARSGPIAVHCLDNAVHLQKISRPCAASCCAAVACAAPRRQARLRSRRHWREVHSAAATPPTLPTAQSVFAEHKTHRLGALVVGHNVAVLDVHHAIGKRAEQRANHTLLALLAPDVGIANGEDHNRVHLDRDGRPAGQQHGGGHGRCSSG